MKFSLFPALTAGLIWHSGCASTNVIVNANAATPMTHQPEHGSVSRSIGLLRRLAILPPQIKFFPSDPKNCMGDCDWEKLKLDVARNFRSYLSEWRGYEIVTPDTLPPDEGSVDLPTANLDEFVDQLAVFAEQRSSEPPPEDLARTVRLIGMQKWVDGLVVIHGSVTVLSRIEGWLAFPLALSGYGLLAALPVEAVRLGSKLEADIFETKTGKLIWVSVYTGPPTPDQAVRLLLDPIEPALPTVMTRTIKPPAHDAME